MDSPRSQEKADETTSCGNTLTVGAHSLTCNGPNPSGLTHTRGYGARLQAIPAPTSAPPPAAAAVPTSFAAGRYQVRRCLGEGSTECVYLPHDIRLDRDVAIALIKTRSLDEPELACFWREAQAIGRLGAHPHIITVYDIGEEDGQPYFVSEYMGGGSVQDLLEQAEHHRLPLARALSIADHLCQALAHAHQCGIIHGDLRPRHVWLTQDGTAKLGGFGLVLSPDRARFTLQSITADTVFYIPPEQIMARRVDARSDLYSLGAMLYEMVAGRPPFMSDVVGIISHHMTTPPAAPSCYNPEVPQTLDALLLRLLAKAPEGRLRSAAAVLEALTAISHALSATVQRMVQEEVNPLDQIVLGAFVGRKREVDELRAGLEDALSGHGRLFMLSGEPGIGKTRTANELAAYARVRGARVLMGRCYGGEGAPPYWPWIQAIGPYMHHGEPKALLSEMGHGVPYIARVGSEDAAAREPHNTDPLRIHEGLGLGNRGFQIGEDGRIGTAASPGQRRLDRVIQAEQARFRLFRRITAFLKKEAQDQPLVLILDNLQWADKPSLLILEFLAQELRDARMLVIGTYRDMEVGRQHPHSQTLAELAREELAQHILLEGLPDQDVASLIEVTTNRKPSPALVMRVYEKTEGNPFFVNEIARLLVTDGLLNRPEQEASWNLTIPQTVREVVGRRLDSLSAECNRVLAIASVIGREFSLNVLEQVADLSRERLLEVVEEALAGHVIQEVAGALGRYSFSHALIRETLYTELPTSRRRLHQQIGEALERVYGANLETHSAELAQHFFQATPFGDVEKAIDYAVRAGKQAITLFAFEEAVGLYELAVQALDLRESDDLKRCEVLLALGNAQRRAGDTLKARETLQRAWDIVRKLGAARHLPRAPLGFEGSSGQGIIDERPVGLLEKNQGMVYDDITTSIDALSSAVRSIQPDPRAYAAPQASVVLPSHRPPVHVLAKPRPSAESNIFRREGEYWTIAYEGTVFRLRDAKGLHYIAYLLCHPGLEVHVADLVAATEKRRVEPAAKSYSRMSKAQLAELHLQVSRLGTAGPMLDSQAKAAYQRRLQELQDELEEAQRFNDPARAGEAQAEIGLIANELGAAYGLGGEFARPTIPWRKSARPLPTASGRA
jgi:tetratricopeptide (TPR) repeat protein